LEYNKGIVVTEFNNVSIIKTANLYFGGQVSSRTLRFTDGTEKTLGIMLPGTYSFNAVEKELMEIQQGKLEVRLSGSDQWNTVIAGESFEIAANSEFTVNVSETTDYCCSYFK
jgi:uncharacterized protein YaiE (UPF0345 family)